MLCVYQSVTAKDRAVQKNLYPCLLSLIFLLLIDMSDTELDISNKELHSLILQSTKSQTDTILSQFNAVINSIKEELQAANAKIDALEVENTSLKQEIGRLQKSVRANNLIIFGIQHCQEETRVDLLNQVITKFNELLQVNCVKNDISDIYRTGKSNKRPIIIKFVSSFMKNDILRNAYKLKGTGIYISRDLLPSERANRRPSRGETAKGAATASGVVTNNGNSSQIDSAVLKDTIELVSKSSVVGAETETEEHIVDLVTLNQAQISTVATVPGDGSSSGKDLRPRLKSGSKEAISAKSGNKRK